MEFLGLKEQAHQYGIGGFSLKLFRLAKSPAGKCENFAIVTDGKLANLNCTPKFNVG